MSFRQLASAGSLGSIAVGIALCLTLVSAGITREAPIGQIEGLVTMLENGRALPEAEIVLRPAVDPAASEGRAREEGLPRYRYARTEDDGTYRIVNVAAGKYTIESYAVAHTMQAKEIEVVEGKVNTVDLKLEPRGPSLDLYASDHVFQPSEQVKFDLHGFVEAETVKIEVFKLRFEDVIREGTLYGALAPLARRGGRAIDPATLGTLHLKEDRPIEGRDVEGTFRLNLFLEPLPEGLYWLRCSVGELSQGTYLSISKLGLVLKRSGRDVFAFATTLDQGSPVSGVDIGYPKNGVWVGSGRTGQNGLARFRLPADLPERNAVIVARQGASAAFVDFYNQSGDVDPGRIYLYTDRPVYRPGDEISFKGIVRNLAGTQYRVPSPGPVEVQVRDIDENLIYNETVQLNSKGSFHGSFSTNKESEPGVFSLRATYKNLEGETGVSVAAYRKPNYSVKVYPEKEQYIRGDKVRMIVECEYYFGGPVGGAKVEASVFQSPAWDIYDPDETYSEYGDEGGGYGGEYFTDVEAVTDSSGKAVLEFDTRLDNEDKKSWADSTFTVNASVADEAGAYFEGEGSVRVSMGEFSLISDSSHYVVEKGQAFDITFKTLNPVSKKPVPSKRLRVVAGYEDWDGLRTNFRPFAERTLTTGLDGSAAVVVTPEKGGSVVVKATSEDAHGNEIQSETHVWCSSRGPGYESRYVETLSLKLDKRQYDTGDKAKALITCTEPGATALLTVEADRIYKAQLVKLENKMTTVELPVEVAYSPNVFVSVCYVKDKNFRSSQRRLLVELDKRHLEVSVKPDRETYKPGETARYLVRTLDAQGRPVSADVSLSVVDESIYAIREDDTDLIAAFYPKRHNEVSTEYSFTTLYLDGGDKAPAGIEIRRLFKDTAYWNPTLTTNEQGVATAAVKLPDNVTTWRATVQAVDGTTAVGEAIAKAVAKKPLMVRLQTPAFYVAGDTQRLAASVTNQSGKAAEVFVELEWSGVTSRDDKRKSLRIEDGETKAVKWTVEAGKPGEAVFVARAWIDQAVTDGVEGRAVIIPRGRIEKSFSSGEVEASTTIRLEVSSSAEPSTGGVTLSLSPTLAAPLFQSLDDLIDFPYGCVEQTMSRFMPAAVVSKVVQDLGLPKPRRAYQLPDIARDSYARLARMQSYEGGWGWWEFDTPDTRMTAYVLEGLHRASQAGLSGRLDPGSALSWAERKLKEPLEFEEKLAWRYRHEEAERIYLAYSLTLYGRNKPALEFLDKILLDKIGANGLAMAVLAYRNLGTAGSARLGLALARLKSLAKSPSERLTQWEEDYWGVETTSRCLQALVAAEPSSPLIPGAIRFLMLARRGDFWSSTQDTAIGLLAISDYLRATQAAFADASMEISVNGRPLATVEFTKESIAEAGKRIEIPMSMLRAGENIVEIRRTGQGTAYYSAELSQTIVQDVLPAFSNLDGVRIERTYHTLEQQPLENGRMMLAPSANPVETFEPGQLVRCVVKVTTSRPLRYLLVEDPIPSNCRVLERENLDIGDDWSNWWISLVVRDDRVAYFAQFVDKGEFRMAYTLRAEQAGASSSLPASVYEMYEPSKRAWSEIDRLEVAR